MVFRLWWLLHLDPKINMAKLFLLFTIVPSIELWLLFKVGSLIGFWETILLVIVTGMIGASMAKREGISVLREIQEAPAKGIPLGDKIGEGLLVLVGGVLLITPGILTDAFGFSLIFPITRRLILPLAKKSFSRNTSQAHFHSSFDFSSTHSSESNPQVSEEDKTQEKMAKHHNKGFKHPTF